MTKLRRDLMQLRRCELKSMQKDSRWSRPPLVQVEAAVAVAAAAAAEAGAAPVVVTAVMAIHPAPEGMLIYEFAFRLLT